MVNDWYSDESDETFFRNKENKMSDELNNIHYEILDAEEHLKKLNLKYEMKTQEIRKYNAPPIKTPCFYECGNDAEGEWQDHSLCGECFTGFTGHQMQGPMRYDYDYTVSLNNSLRNTLVGCKAPMDEQLIDYDPDSGNANCICEFCKTPYNESKTNHCYQCECMREGRMHPTMDTLREQTSEETLQSYGLSKRQLCQCKTCEGLGYEINSDGNCKYCVAHFDSKDEERINKAEERYTKLCIGQDEGGPVYD